MRGLLDNLYLSNRPRPVLSDQVNLESFIDWVPSSPIRLKPGAKPADDHVMWMQAPSIAPAAGRTDVRAHQAGRQCRHGGTVPSHHLLGE
jgi:hypothetical protein